MDTLINVGVFALMVATVLGLVVTVITIIVILRIIQKKALAAARAFFNDESFCFFEWFDSGITLDSFLAIFE